MSRLARAARSKDAASVQAKRARGAYYTQGNPFLYAGFAEWFAQIPAGTRFVEPFAGSRQIPRLLNAAGYPAAWTCFDVDKSLSGVRHRDTLMRFPRGFDVALTNPPYLSYHFAKRKGLLVDKAYFRGHKSLYEVAVDQALENCSFVGMIIPESFLTRGLFRGRLEHVISLPFRMFDDTEMPTALVLWGPDQGHEDFVVWREEQRLGDYSALADPLWPTPCAHRIRFNVRSGQVGFRGVDRTEGPSIAFCERELIPTNSVKPSARLNTRIAIAGLRDAEQIIEIANAHLNVWRRRTEDVLLTAFKGTRRDGRFRRRLDFATARALLSHALCQAEGHSH